MESFASPIPEKKKHWFKWPWEYNSSLIFDDRALNAYVTENNIPKSRLPAHLRVSTRERFVLYLIKEGYIRDLEIFQALVSVLFALIYIIQSYMILQDQTNVLAVPIIDLTLCAFVAGCFLIHFIISKNKLKFLFLNPYSYLDYLIVFPIVFMYILLFIRPNRLAFANFIGVIRLVRLLRLILVIRSYQGKRFRNIYRQVFVLALLIVCLILLFAGVFQTLENYFGEQVLYFHDSVYFIWVTIATIGYGDITPHTIEGKYFVILFFIICVIVIPYQTSQIFNLLTAKETVFRWFNFGIKDHMIVTGISRYTDVLEFAKEFFHEQHGNVKAKKLLFIFKDKELCEQLARLADNSYYSNRIAVYEGDVADYETLTLVNAHKAHAVFILSNSNATDPREVDTATLMMTLACKHFNSKLEVYAQIILPENKSFLIQAGATSIVCTEDLKLKLMSLSVVFPGLSTLVANLSTSFSFRSPLRVFRKKLKRGQASEQDRWMYEYCDGISNEFYTVSFSPYFYGTLFLDAALSIYQDLQIILFAVFAADRKCVLLNPSDYLIKGDDQAIVIATNIFEAQLVNLYKYDRADTQQSILADSNSDEGVVHKHSGPYQPNAGINTLEDPSPTDKDKIEEDDYFHYREQTAFENFLEMKEVEKKKLTSSKANVSKDVINQRQVHKLLRYIAPLTELKQLLKKRKDISSIVLSKKPSDEMEKELFGKALNRFNLLRIARSEEDFLLNNRTFSNHIIVAGSLKGAAYITLTLRSMVHQKFAPIIFLSNDENILPFLYDRLKFFDSVYFMKGSPIEKYDLRKAGASEASCFLYISDVGKEVESMDSEAVKCMLGMRWIEKKSRYLCEIGSRSNIKYFKPATAYTGERFSKYTQVLNDVSSETVADDATEKFERMCMISEVYSSGRVFPNSVFARVLCQSYYNPKIVPTIEVLCGFSGFLAKDQSATFQISCPQELVNRIFSEAFTYFYRHDTICLGLFRPKHCAGGSNRLEYVYCNPEPSAVITEGDKFFVVGSRKSMEMFMTENRTKSSYSSKNFLETRSETTNSENIITGGSSNSISNSSYHNGEDSNDTEPAKNNGDHSNKEKAQETLGSITRSGQSSSNLANKIRNQSDEEDDMNPFV